MSRPYFRKHIRLKGFDYTSSHYYFVTICTKNRELLFVPRISKKYNMDFPSVTTETPPSNLILPVAAGLVPANKFTEILENVLDNIPTKYNAEIDFYCIMPEHIHLIIKIIIGDHKGRGYNLGQIIGGFKSIATRKLWKTGFKERVFQSNYYEHIIRSEDNLNNIRNYILNNPSVEYEDIEWKMIDSAKNLTSE